MSEAGLSEKFDWVPAEFILLGYVQAVFGDTAGDRFRNYVVDKCECFSYAQLGNQVCVFYQENSLRGMSVRGRIEIFLKANAEFLQCPPWEALIIQVFQGLDKNKEYVRDSIKIRNSLMYKLLVFVRDTGRQK